MTDEFDPYKPGTGLKDDFDGTILDGVFTADPQSGNSKIILMTVDDAGEEYPVNYWLGPDWESYDGGNTVTHPKGDRTAFSGNSQYSDFMVHAMDAGAKDEMYKRLGEGKGPRYSSNWDDMYFHWEILQRPTRRPKVDENGDRVKDANGRDIWEAATTPRLLPTKFLGLKRPGAGMAAPVPSAPTAVQGTATPTDLPLDPVTNGKVRRAAQNAGSYEEWVDACLEITDADGRDIMDIQEVGRFVADRASWDSLRNPLT